MVIDIPANFIEQVQKIDWGSVREAVKDYRPVLTVLRDTWDRETLAQIAEGHLFVRDSLLNARKRASRSHLHNDEKI